MRYREGQAPDPDNPYGANTHFATDFSMVLGIFIGIALFWMGRRGRMIWLQVWSVGLVVLAIIFLGQRYLT